jgi:hypothetical protein
MLFFIFLKGPFPPVCLYIAICHILLLQSPNTREILNVTTHTQTRAEYKVGRHDNRRRDNEDVQKGKGKGKGNVVCNFKYLYSLYHVILIIVRHSRHHLHSFGLVVSNLLRVSSAFVQNVSVFNKTTLHIFIGIQQLSWNVGYIVFYILAFYFVNWIASS